MPKFEIMQPNPAWADRILRNNWSLIESKVGHNLMPYPTSPGKSSFDELGCGHYGCVYSTQTDGTVFKITSDVTEAVFISCAIDLGDDYPEGGIVRYGGVWEVPGEKFKKRNVFVLTREEAENVGGLRYAADALGRGWNSAQRAINRLTKFKEFAHLAREKINNSSDKRKTVSEIIRLKDWAEDIVSYSEISEMKYNEFARIPSHLKGARGAAYAVQACRIIADEMSGEDVGYAIGTTLREFLDEGLLLADVHTGNVGQVTRGAGNSVWVITDPGHVVPIRDRWLDVAVASL